MSKITSADIIEWKNHPVTKSLLESIEQEICDTRDSLLSLCETADTGQIKYLSGYISGLDNMLHSIEDGPDLITTEEVK